MITNVYTNVYHESERVIAQLKSGEIPRGSIIKVQWPSGNSEYIRFHGWSSNQNSRHRVFMVGCSMGWDNLATEYYDLSQGVVTLVEKPKPNDERWRS